MNESTDRLAGALGILWALATVVLTFAAGTPPDIDGSAGEIREYLADNRGLWLATIVVWGLTLPLALSFFLSLVGRLRVTNATSRAASPAALLGLSLGIAFTALPFVALVPVVVNESLLADTSDDLIRFLWAFVFASTMVSNIGFGVALSGVASAGEGAPLAAPLRWAAGLIGAILIVVSSIGLANSDVAMIAGAGIALVCLWVIAAGVQMLGVGSGSMARRAASA
jgi:hypothetical protein